MENTKQFSIDDIQEVATDESVEFAIARIAVLSTRPNSHKVNITEEILRRDGISVRGKWIIAEYDKWKGDVTTHTKDTTIVGIVPQDAKIDFVTTDDGYVVMYTDAIISKIYATDFYRMFRDGVNGRNVSVEMATRNDMELPDGSTDIDGLNIYSICVLGQKINGSCPDANMKITKFSEQEANEFYNKAFAFNKIKSMANELLDFANSQLELETQSKGDNMEENKNLSEQPKDEDIVMEEPNQQEIDDTEAVKGDAKTDEVEGESKEMAEEEKPTEKEESPKTEEKEMSEETKEMGCGEDKEMGCGEDKEMAETSNGEETKEMSEEQSIEEKTFSEQAVEFADEDHKDFVEKLFSRELKDMVEEVVELKKFMETTVKANTEKRFSEIMVEPKLCLGEKAYNVLFEEGSKLSLNELDAFEQKVKAFCEDAPKKQEASNEMLMFSCGDVNTQINTDLSVEELIKKYN